MSIDLIWASANGPVQVRDMTTLHIWNALAQLKRAEHTGEIIRDRIAFKRCVEAFLSELTLRGELRQ